MIMLSVRGVQVRRGQFSLGPLDFDVHEGECLAVLGGSSSGKTLLGDILAGLCPPERGTVMVAGRDVTVAAAGRRGVGILFQDDGLFPHLTVGQNLDFGSRYAGADRSEAEARVRMLAGLLGLDALHDRYPFQLGRGETRKVALARTLAGRPRVVVLDAPFEGLGAQEKDEMRHLLASLLASARTSALLLTRDLVDASALAKRALFLDNGLVVQQGSMQELLQFPASRNVASFLGIKNIFAAEFRQTTAVAGGVCFDTGLCLSAGGGWIGIRPDDIVPGGLSAPGAVNLQGRVSLVFDLGLFLEAHVRVEGLLLRVHLTRSTAQSLALRKGSAITLGVMPSSVKIFRE
jgi:molybdate/tungstate transport system ATP-binding protein